MNADHLVAHRGYPSCLPENTLPSIVAALQVGARYLEVDVQVSRDGEVVLFHDRELQRKMFSILGFSDEEAQSQFGFLMNAFEYGAPPHGGVAFGFDRWCALFGGSDSIRDFIAFPKNNAGRDVMIDSPSAIADEQLDELNIALKKKAE